MPLFSFPTHARRAYGLLHRDVDRVKLMVAGDLLRYRTPTEIFEHDEVANQVEKAPLIENSLDHDLEFRQVVFSQRLSGNRTPGLEPLPARAERTDARLDSIRNQQGLVVGEQRLNLGLISL